MGDSDIQAMLGLISHKQNEKIKKRKKQQAKLHPTSSHTSSGSGSKVTSGDSGPKHEKEDVSIFHPKTVLHSFKKDFLGSSPVEFALDNLSRLAYGASSSVNQGQKNELAMDKKYGSNRGEFHRILDDIVHPKDAFHNM